MLSKTVVFVALGIALGRNATPFCPHSHSFAISRGKLCCNLTDPYNSPEPEYNSTSCLGKQNIFCNISWFTLKQYCFGDKIDINCLS